MRLPRRYPRRWILAPKAVTTRDDVLLLHEDLAEETHVTLILRFVCGLGPKRLRRRTWSIPRPSIAVSIADVRN